jgi:hypothetical protein
MIEVAATDVFVAWYETISVDAALAIEHAVAHIELQGSGYGEIVQRVGEGGAVRIHQLRIPQGNDPANPTSPTSPISPISLCYATDIFGRFVLLLSGDTSGAPDLCNDLVGSAEKLWRDYLRTTTNGHGVTGSHRPI